MAMNHLNKLWLDAEPALVEKIARKLCERHGREIFGEDALTPYFMEAHWRCFECEARDAIAIVRENDAAP